MSKQAIFNDNWIDPVLNVDNPDFLVWLERHPKSNIHAYCKLCKSDISLSNMGVVALKSHASGKRHSTKIRALVKAIDDQILALQRKK